MSVYHYEQTFLNGPLGIVAVIALKHNIIPVILQLSNAEY